MGGIFADGLESVTISFDGTLVFSDDMDEWPRSENGDVHECFKFSNFKDVTFTSSGKGLIDGKGGKWWGIPGIGYLRRGENRPRLFAMDHGTNILMENIILKDSPYWTTYFQYCEGLEIRFCEISARRTEKENHNLVDITAFNTDGFDVTGNNVWIHDCSIWNQDDTIAVKGDSSNMLFERITASGVGLTIGSIGNNHVQNITFRDCYMPNTYKGLYLKFRDGDSGLIENVTFENIVIDNPSQWPIWLGPAQQSDSSRLCAAHPCSICWPLVPFSKCNPSNSQYDNILFKNITINNPEDYPGVILGNMTQGAMTNIVFEDVVVNNPKKGKEEYYVCEGVKTGVAKGKTFPVPSCFDDQTDAALELA